MTTFGNRLFIWNSQNALESMLSTTRFSGLFASLVFHPTVEWKQHKFSQDQPRQESSLYLARKKEEEKRKEKDKIEEEG